MEIMKKNFWPIIAIALFIAVAFTSCETATGSGALWGAGAGAVLGGLTSRHHQAENAALGALIGAHTGAIIGASIDEANAVRYGPRPRGGYPFAEPTERPGLYVSPYPPHRVYDLRHVPPGGLVEDRVGRGYFRKP